MYSKEIAGMVAFVIIFMIIMAVSFKFCVEGDKSPPPRPAPVAQVAPQQQRSPDVPAEVETEEIAVVTLAEVVEFSLEAPAFGSSFERFAAPELTFNLEELEVEDLSGNFDAIIEASNTEAAIAAANITIDTAINAMAVSEAFANANERINTALDEGASEIDAIQGRRLDRVVNAGLAERTTRRAAVRLHAATALSQAATEREILVANQERSIVEQCVPLLSAANQEAVQCPEIPDLSCPTCPETRAISLLRIEHSNLTAERESVCQQRIEATIAVQETIFDKMFKPWFVIVMLIGAAVIMAISLFFSGRKSTP